MTDQLQWRHYCERVFSQLKQTDGTLFDSKGAYANVGDEWLQCYNTSAPEPYTKATGRTCCWRSSFCGFWSIANAMCKCVPLQKRSLLSNNMISHLCLCQFQIGLLSRAATTTMTSRTTTLPPQTITAYSRRSAYWIEASFLIQQVVCLLAHPSYR